MPNYWAHCGFDTLQVSPDNQLLVTDDFLRTYLSRPELALVPESCPKERAIHQRLLNNPREEVAQAEIEQMADADIQANYAIWFRYRTKLLAASSLENFYMSLFEGEGVDVPPLFVAQLTQIFLRHILGTEVNPFDARIAELFFRPQKITILEDGIVMAADHETIERNAQASEFGNIIDLLKSQSIAMRTVDLDVLHEDNAKSYWGRDQAHDFAIQLNFDQATLPALAKILEKWINHFLGITTTITPLKEINDPKWVWHVGLDASATEILNSLYNKERVDEATLSRIICLFKLDFNDPNTVISQIRGKPIYLGMAMNGESLLKLKPQNVIFNLPLNPVS
ncbi:MAG: DUF6352 family protein [Polynucleobacter sp.]|jgi:hypothetical protein